MFHKRKFVCWLIALPIMLQVGCQKKKASLPPQTQAPTVAVQLPDELPLSEIPAEPSPAVAQTAQKPSATVATKPKRSTRNTSKSATAKKNSSPNDAKSSASAGSSQTVASLRSVKPGAAEPASITALAAAIPDAQLNQQKDETTRLIDATENDLKSLTRSLNDDEKAMRSQVQSYLQQSRKATTDGDYERAYNLAKKAQLLAAALVKK